MAKLVERIDALEVEVAAQRLIMRSMIAHILLHDRKNIPGFIGQFEDAIERMSREHLPMADLDPDLHERAYALASSRADDLIRDLKRLLFPRRTSARAADFGHLPLA